MAIWHNPHSHPHKQQGERRRWLRWPDKQRVVISDPKDEQPAFVGWLLDRSPGGICLWLEDQRIYPGAVLKVQSVDVDGPLSDDVRVVNVRRRYGKALLGCAYMRHDEV